MHNISRLPVEHLDFLEKFILNGFSIKMMAENEALGYAAIRTRLDRIIELSGKLADIESNQKEILERLESGEIEASTAKNLLDSIQSRKIT